MKEQDFFRAPPVTWDQVAAITNSLRRELGQFDTKFFPVIQVLERVLDQKLEIVRLDVEFDDVMGEVEGFTDPAGEFIRLSERVYRQAYEKRPRARWTVAHEMGHLFLHTRKPLTRVAGSHEAVKIRPFECPERQAHQFAAELLIPRHLLSGLSDFETVMREFGVSEEAAKKRLAFIKALKK